MNSVEPALTVRRQRVVLAAREGYRQAQLGTAACQQTDWQLERVTSGDAVVRSLREPCELLLIDATLPTLSAFEVVGIVRARPDLRDLPVLVLEFDRPNGDRATRALAAGATDYVDSTSHLPAVLSRIRSVLLNRKSDTGLADAAAVSFKGEHLLANFDEMFVSGDGKPIVLPRLELQVLRYLVKRRNQVVTREELYRAVWHDRMASLESRTVNVHLCRLRRKLGVAADHIQTLVFFGYRFVDSPVWRSVRRASVRCRKDSTDTTNT